MKNSFPFYGNLLTLNSARIQLIRVFLNGAKSPSLNLIGRCQDESDEKNEIFRTIALCIFPFASPGCTGAPRRRTGRRTLHEPFLPQCTLCTGKRTFRTIPPFRTLAICPSLCAVLLTRTRRNSKTFSGCPTTFSDDARTRTQSDPGTKCSANRRAQPGPFS